MNCEKCGKEMISRVDGSSLVIECPNCGWNIVTTYIEPVYEDQKTYRLLVLPGNPSTKPVLSAVSKAAGVNFLGAKPIIENGGCIFEGAALEIVEKKHLLDEALIAYAIEPDFPY